LCIIYNRGNGVCFISFLLCMIIVCEVVSTKPRIPNQ
jgi:hypothetical protein